MLCAFSIVWKFLHLCLCRGQSTYMPWPLCGIVREQPGGVGAPLPPHRFQGFNSNCQVQKQAPTKNISRAQIFLINSLKRLTIALHCINVFMLLWICLWSLAAWADLKLPILVPPPPSCWVYRHVNYAYFISFGFVVVLRQGPTL